MTIYSFSSDPANLSPRRARVARRRLGARIFRFATYVGRKGLCDNQNNNNNVAQRIKGSRAG